MLEGEQMIVRYGRTTRAQRRRKLEEIGVIGKCDACGKHADTMGFKCVCKRIECIKCWFKRTRGHENVRSPSWKCPGCKRVSIYDQEMNFIKRWSSEEWKQYNRLGEQLDKGKGKKDGYEIAEGTI